MSPARFAALGTCVFSIAFLVASVIEERRAYIDRWPWLWFSTGRGWVGPMNAALIATATVGATVAVLASSARARRLAASTVLASSTYRVLWLWLGVSTLNDSMRRSASISSALIAAGAALTLGLGRVEEDHPELDGD